MSLLRVICALLGAAELCDPRKSRPCSLSFAAKVSLAEITKDLHPAEASRAQNTSKGHVGKTSP